MFNYIILSFLVAIFNFYSHCKTIFYCSIEVCSSLNYKQAFDTSKYIFQLDRQNNIQYYKSIRLGILILIILK